MNNIRTLIVDDIPLARERVRHYLELERDIEIVGEAATGVDAVQLVAQLSPHLVFLDVQLPDLDGFEIVNQIPRESRPVVVYVTAHEDKAIKAFEMGALDYLTKPFDQERFDLSLRRARSQIHLWSAQRGIEKIDYLERLAIKNRERTEFVAMRDIDFIDVAGHYICVHVGKTVHLIRGALHELEFQLDPGQFARIHRSAIVRLDRIKSLALRRNSDYDLLLADGGQLLLSRTYSESVRRQLGLLEG
jgi:two-component system, LytTR family, response regulator